MSLSDPELIDCLEEAIANLQWTSESDYPFQVIYWAQHTLAELTIPRLLHLTEHSPDTPVVSLDLKKFFSRSTQPQTWHGPKEQDTVRQYQHLVETLRHHLSELAVYQVGEMEVDIYILGQTPSNTVMGLSTKAVAT